MTLCCVAGHDCSAFGKTQQRPERGSTAFGKRIKSCRKETEQHRTNSTALKGHSFTGSEAQLHSLQKNPQPQK
jgi:hypothetical protein